MKYYSVLKTEIGSGKTIANYGSGYTIEDVKAICKGYAPDPDPIYGGVFWTRKNGKYVFIVEEEK